MPTYDYFRYWSTQNKFHEAGGFRDREMTWKNTKTQNISVCEDINTNADLISTLLKWGSEACHETFYYLPQTRAYNEVVLHEWVILLLDLTEQWKNINPLYFNSYLKSAFIRFYPKIIS